MGPQEKMLSEEIRQLAEPVLNGIYKSVWEQQLILPAKFQKLAPNSLEEKLEDVEGNEQWDVDVFVKDMFGISCLCLL